MSETERLAEDSRRIRPWRLWGPYLADRQWGTVREDYSQSGDCWAYFPHDHARSRAYRWGEDGLLGICDRECRLNFAVALWNGKDRILKERLFGLTGPEGNHGEDVKELYYYLDATPTASYLKALYKYPQQEFPYARLVEENRRRGRGEREFELEDTGAFDAGYWDVFVEYAKASPDDILIKFTLANRGNAAAELHVLPHLWLRNTWSWGRKGEGYDAMGSIERAGDNSLQVVQPTLGTMRLDIEPSAQWLFTDNETNYERLFGVKSASRFTKDAFHRCVVGGDRTAVNPAQRGTKAAAWCTVSLPAGGERVLRLRLAAGTTRRDSFSDFDQVFAARQAEADQYHRSVRTAPMTEAERAVVRQADAGLVWSRKFYHYILEHWQHGDPGQPPVPQARSRGRNHGWEQLWARDIIAMPDGWEFPWFAAWDLAFHCVAQARFDPQFAKQQLLLLMREWYMHPNGQLPAYEFALGDVNPPVHAWAVWRIYQLAAEAGHGQDREFLERAFDKCLINFTWWVNRQDPGGENLFTGGFLGLDNIGIFDRSTPLAGVGKLVQADATAWMAFYCTTMLAMALELAKKEQPYSDLALKFFDHFVAIARATNTIGDDGLWSQEDGFYYDQIRTQGTTQVLRIRSLVGLVPLLAAESLDDELLHSLPRFAHRLAWFFENRPELASAISIHSDADRQRRLLAIPSRERLARVLTHVLDEKEFLSPYGVRSLSRYHLEHPYVMECGGQHHEVHYTPGESDTGLFGGNSNWRGPIWFPLNYLLIEALKRYHHFFGDGFTVECPTGSGVKLNLGRVAEELECRLARLFLPNSAGHRPCFGDNPRYAIDPQFRDLVLFHEFFHGDSGRGLGASHQTGWTALAANIIERVASTRDHR